MEKSLNGFFLFLKLHLFIILCACACINAPAHTLVCVCVCSIVCVCRVGMPWQMYRSWFSPSTEWTPEIKLGSSGLVVDTLTL